jgi:MFS transporter, MHS family, proline/betaine transporter
LSPTASGRPPAKPIVSAVIGNFMEFFDFAVYGFLAVTIGKLFFPAEDPGAQLLSSLAVFGVTFVFRPVGGLIFGYIGDRLGRKVSLATSVILMSLTTAAIGVLPTYAAVGVLAPILLVLTRLIQGISVGGEFTGAAAYIGEYVPQAKRGRFSALLPASTPIGFAAGSATVLILTTALGAESMAEWGWRIPFLLALPMGAIGLYMRLKLEDTPVFTQLQETEGVSKSPLKRLTKRDWIGIAVTIVFSMATGFGFFYFTTYFNSYLAVTVGMPTIEATTLSLISLVVFSGFVLLAGRISDAVGRKRVFITGAIVMGVVVVPVFLLLGAGFLPALVGLLLFAAAQAAMLGVAPTILVELFPAETRMTAGALGYNIGVSISGIGPFVAAALVAGTGVAIAPAFLLAVIVIVAAILLIVVLPETSQRSLFATESHEADAAVPTGK